MELKFHPDIRLELSSSYDWYESKAAGLGDDLLEALGAAFNSIREMPLSWPVLGKGFRRFLLHRFPFGVIYKVMEDSVFIVAVMHTSRKPDYWEDRLD